MSPDEIAQDMLVEEFDAIVEAAGRAWDNDQPGTSWSAANRDWYLVAAAIATERTAREKAEAAVERLTQSTTAAFADARKVEERARALRGALAEANARAEKAEAELAKQVASGREVMDLCNAAIAAREKAEAERDAARKKAGIDHDAANRYVNEMMDAKARAEKAEAERDEAVKHLRNWMKWCEQLRPGDEHPFDHWKAAHDFLSLIPKQEPESNG